MILLRFELITMAILRFGHLSFYLATSLAFYTSEKRLSLKKLRKKVWKGRGSRGLSAPGLKKNRTRVENDYFSSSFRVFGPFSTFFRLFWASSTPGPRGPGNPFSDFFRSFLGRGLFDSCRRPTMSQFLPLVNLNFSSFSLFYKSQFNLCWTGISNHGWHTLGGVCRVGALLPSFFVSHYSGIGNTISCDAPYSAIGFRGKFFLRCPPSKACLLIAIGHFCR